MANILITGSNRGIGLEFVKQYAHQGHHILACCRTPDEAKELNQLHEQFPNHIQIHTLDVGNFEQIETLAEELYSTAIDVLISNAGIYLGQGQSPGNINYQDWQEIFQINTMASMKLTECFLPHLQNGNEKKIAFLTSKMGSMSDNTSGGSYLYRSSKAALNAVIRSLSFDLKALGISTVALHPGWVQTSMGGPNAWITAKESVAGMKKIIDGMTVEQSGGFIAYDGKLIDW